MPEETTIVDTGDPGNTGNEPAPPQEATPTQSQPAFDPNNIPETHRPFYDGARAHFEAEYSKRYQDYDAYKKESEALRQLSANPDFRAWYEKKRSGQTDQPPAPSIWEQMTPEDFANVASDPKKFGALLKSELREMAKAESEPKVRELQEKLVQLTLTTQIRDFSKEHPDFYEKYEGRIRDLWGQNPNLSVEQVYKLAKYDDLDKEATARAKGIVDGKKSATTVKPGVSHTGTRNVVKVRNVREAMSIAADEAEAGRPIPEFDGI